MHTYFRHRFGLVSAINIYLMLEILVVCGGGFLMRID